GRRRAAVQAAAGGREEAPPDGAAVPGRVVVGAGQAGQRPGVRGRRHVGGLVPAGSEAVPVAGVAQPGRAPAAAPELGPPGQGVPGRGARLQLTRAVEGDLRGVGGRLARWVVSSVPTGQQGRSSRPGGPGGTGGGAESAAAPADSAQAGAVTAAPGRRPPAAVRYAPVLLAAAVMAVLGVWGLARDSSMGN